MGLYEFSTIKIFTESEVDKIIKLSDTFSLEPAKIGGTDPLVGGIINPSIRISNIKWINKSPETKWIYKKIYEALKTANDNYYKFHLKGLESLQYTIYEGNEKGKYDSHVDTNEMLVGGKSYIRKISISVLLSNESDFSGGQLMVDGSGNDVIPEHKKGYGIIFPSFTRHRVFPVTSGRRITLVAWAYGDFFV